MRSKCRLWTHTVFTTKKREPLIHKSVEIDIHQHMFGQLKKQGCHPIIINGTENHLHLLFASNYKKSLMEIMRDVKGETSFWCNKNQLMPYKLEWQDGFGAFSVSEDHIERIRQYILNQKKHHNEKTFEEEQLEMTKKFRIVIYEE